jgi:integrase/recombinase XerC
MCGLRSCEVLNLVIDGVDFVNSQIKILGKGNKERVVPFPKQLRIVIQKYLQYERPMNCNHQKVFVALQGKRRSEPMTKEGLRNFFRYRRAKSGVHDAKPHRWRHTFGTEMARAGVSYESLQKMMGHSPGSPITSQYIHLSMADIANEYNQAIKRIEQNYEIKKVSK